MKIIVMGVSGSGKTTIGQLLAQRAGAPFFDADDYHPASNVAKMKSGQPLNDEDRKPWLETLAKLISQHDSLVLACSALKESYRQILDPLGKVHFVWLHGSAELIAERMKARPNHYMPESLLKSQIDTLEPPKNAIPADISQSPDEIVERVWAELL